VEKAETRKNSQLAREINIALPRELTDQQQKDLIKNYIQTEFVDKGMIADIAIHRDDKENPHCHVMLTTREISAEGFTVKNRDWNQRELLEQWRAQWSEYANRELEKIGVNKITHLSHKARGLEELPTIHLGHIAAGMEKEGKKSDRGNINREIQKHNAIIIDFQKYREERAAILKRRQEQAPKPEKSFYKPDERLAIEKAETVIGEKVTFSSIDKRRKELAAWKEHVEQNSSATYQKGKHFEGVKVELAWINKLETRIQEQQAIIKNAGFFEKRVKNNARAEIARLESDLNYRNEKLRLTLQKLGVSNKESFEFESKTFDKTRTELNKKFMAERKEISKQSTILEDAEKALKQGQKREITSSYPELKNAGEYMNYFSALKLNQINKIAGKIVPLEQIKAEITQRKKSIEERTQHLNNFKKFSKNVSAAGKYFNELDAVEQKIGKIENNPFLKGKLRISKEAKKEFDQLKQQQEHYKLILKNLGYENKETFIKDKAKVQEYEPKLPVAEQQIKDLQDKGQSGIGLVLLEGALQGIEQAQRQEEREHQKKVRKQRSKGLKQQQEELGR
jgi:hypothetical protein